MECGTWVGVKATSSEDVVVEAGAVVVATAYLSGSVHGIPVKDVTIHVTMVAGDAAALKDVATDVATEYVLGR